MRCYVLLTGVVKSLITMIRQNKALSSQTLIRRLPSTCDENRLNKEVYGRILGQEIATATAARMRLEVDLSGIRHNAALILRISRGAKMMAVVKGNAYGLGASVVAGVLSTGGAHALAVDNVAEGIELRRDAISLPILVIDGDVPENASLAVRHKLMPG